MVYDAIIIGAGHNGLTCAGYLAQKGKSVLVLERRDVVGGAALTSEFSPGFKNSEFSYVVSLLDPSVIKDLELAKYGLQIKQRDGASMTFGSDGCLWLPSKLEKSYEQIARHSKKDADNYLKLDEILEGVCKIFRPLARNAPFDVGASLSSQIRNAVNTGWILGNAEPDMRSHVVEFITKSVGDYLDQWFETDILKGTLAYSGSVGNFVSPYHPSTAYVLLHHVFGQVNGKTGAWGHAHGGMGSITQALAKSAQALGVKIKTDAEVAGALLNDNKIDGVRLSDGEEYRSKVVIANCHPNILFGNIIKYDELPEDFCRRMKGYRSESGSFRINLALSDLPKFPQLKTFDVRPEILLNGSNNIVPSIPYIERAYQDACEFGWSKEPVIYFCLPCLIDDSLAPKGAHVMSLFCQHFRRHLPNSMSWVDEKDRAAALVINTLEQYSPGFQKLIVGKQINSPLDIEEKLNMVGGDIFHGALHIDQLYSMRPVVGAGNYRMPISGLYLGGSGAHPGGGVSGLPGKNCANAVLQDI